MKTTKNNPIYVLKNYCEKKKNADILLTEEEHKKLYGYIRDFNTFLYDHLLHQGRKHFVVIVYKLLAWQKD